MAEQEGLKQFRCGCLAVAVLGLSLGSLPGALAVVPPFVGVNPGAPIWGGSILFTDALAADIAATGCRFVRINFRIDGNSTWKSSLLAKYDTIIANARNHDLQVLGLICYEMLPAGQDQWNDDPDGNGMNSYVTDFAATAYMLINRYRNDVKVWEVWNEPDCWGIDPAHNDPRYVGCFYILPRVYANVLAETYKQCNYYSGRTLLTDYGILLSTGGLFAHEIGGLNPPTGYADELYSTRAGCSGNNCFWNDFEALTGRRYPWDYFGFHFYLDQGQAVQTSKLAYYFDQVQVKKNQYADPTDFLVTEFGWNTYYPEMPQQLQADNLRDSYNYMRSRGDIASAHWFCWADWGTDQWGLVSGSTPKLSYAEFVDQCAAVGAPVANFSAAPLAGHAPLAVQFADASSGLIDTWFWSFGDSQTSTASSPQHTYTAPGAYTVSLTVTGPGGSDTQIRAAYVVATPPPDPADLDDDGDVDLKDFGVFAYCHVTSYPPPPSCQTAHRALPPPTVQWESAGSLAGLSQAMSAGDLIHNVSGVKEAGGFHSATPGGDVGGLADLTDGVPGGGAEAVLADFARPALQVRYDFSPARGLERIHVFAANGDGRVFQNYDVQYSVTGSAAFQTLQSDVTSGPFGQVNSGSVGATLTRLVSPDARPIAQNVDSLRFIFYAVSGIDRMFRDELDAGETGDTDGLPRAFESSIVKEIDVFEYTGPPPVGNLADIDRNGTVDLADFALLAGHLTGPP